MTGWTEIASAYCDGAGSFGFTNLINPAHPQLFYRLQLP
jgi:hypothetical protein